MISERFLLFIFILFVKSAPAFAQKMVCKKLPVSTPASCSIKPVKSLTAILDLAKACVSLVDEGYTDEFVLEYLSFSDGASMTSEDYKKSIAFKKVSVEEIKQQIKKTELKIKNFNQKDYLKRKEEKEIIRTKMNLLRQKNGIKDGSFGQVSNKGPEYLIYLKQMQKLREEFDAVGDLYSKEELIDHLKEYKKDVEMYQKVIKDEEGKMAQLLNKSEKKLSPSEKERENVKKAVLARNETFKNKADFVDCGLTDIEMYAINMYTDDYFRPINSSLRSQNLNEQKKYQAFAAAINSGLSKLQGFKEMVRRGANLTDEAAKEYCEGCVVTMKAFTSTSSSDGFHGKHRFMINGKSGVYIAPLSHASYEKEVLFPTNAKFKVIKIDKNEYTLQEVD